MEFAFLLKKLLTKLAMPPFSLLLLGVLGLLLSKRWPRIGRAIVWTSMLTTWLLATPNVAQLLLRSLDLAPPFNQQAAKSAQAIVVLGGGLRLRTPEYGDTPTEATLDRIRYGAIVAKQMHLPVLVSGGAVVGKNSEAEIMAEVLEREFSTPVRWKETRSLDTEDNLKYSAALLKQEGIKRVVLVTHDYHMLRSLAHCEIAGLICTPAPVSFVGNSGEFSLLNYLPDARALELSSTAIHEMLGYIVLSLK
jgi:uncharacterized SAM-binding protein YcdF (DUF218 family)